MEKVTYKNQIHTLLIKMVPGQKIELSKICKPGNEQKFIDACTALLRENWDVYGWKITFSADYSRLIRNESRHGETFDEFFNLHKPRKK